VSFSDAQIVVRDTKVPLQLPSGDKMLKLRIFIDRSVMEVFANDTVCFTKTTLPPYNPSSVSVRSDGGAARLKRLQAWPMKTIW
jgi:beta-fructofuranosidase